MTEQKQCGFHFGPGVRCLMVDGHDQPYYRYIDRGQTGYYSEILSRGTAHQVLAPASEVPPSEEWTGLERCGGVQNWPAFSFDTAAAR